MSALIKSLHRCFQPTAVAPAGPCPLKALKQGRRGNPSTLAEQHVR
jgi:hypothetical protein